MARDEKRPAVRFAGFTDPWEQRKLGEIGKTQSGIGFPETEQGVKTGIPFYKVSDMNNKGNENEMLKANNYVSEEQVEKRRWKPIETVPAIMFAKVGAALMLNRKRLINVPFLLDNNTMVYIPGSSWNTEFAKSLFETIYLPQFAQVGALPSFNGSDIETIEVMVPQKLEQARIGTFFTSIDNLITLHQRKYDKLVSVKKSMLEKMFPKNGSNKPEIRFSGFTDPWEQRKLGDVAEIVGGGTPNTSIIEYWGDEIDWYAPAEIGDQIFLTGSQKKISEAGLKHSSAKILPVGTVLFTSRAGIGNTAILAKIAATNQGFQSIVPHGNELDSYFIFSRTHELKQYAETVGAGSTFTEVSGKQMAKMPILIPKLPEQLKIGGFFKMFDNLITLHQRELEKLKNIKKSMLEKMFV
jgi:type I restriction enzyme, S subunit